MEDDLEKALVLLRLISEQQAKTNAAVVVDNQMAADAGLEYRGSPIYDIVVGALLEEEALEVDRETSEYGFDSLPGASEYGTAFNITPSGEALLQRPR